MKISKTGFLSLLFIALMTITAYSQNLAVIKADIEKINSELNQAVVDGDMDAGLKYYTDDIISMPNWSPMMRGKEAIKKENEAMMEQGVNFKSFNTETLDVFAGGNLIIEVGKYNLTLEMSMMPEPIKDFGKYLTVWEVQKDGSLKIKIETWNTDVNPMRMK